MELHSVDVTLLDDGGEFRAVGAGRGGRAMRIERGVRMRKIKICASFNASKQGRVTLLFKLIPAHVRELHTWRQCGNDSGQQIQALELGGFFARLEEHLQAQANPQKRHTAVDGIDQRRAEFLFVERTNKSSVMSYAGEEQSLRF